VIRTDADLHEPALNATIGLDFPLPVTTLNNLRPRAASSLISFLDSRVYTDVLGYVLDKYLDSCSDCDTQPDDGTSGSNSGSCSSTEVVLG
jgi:hypothetical protein